MRIGDIVVSRAGVAGDKGQVSGGTVDFEVSSLKVEGMRAVEVAISNNQQPLQILH